MAFEIPTSIKVDSQKPDSEKTMAGMTSEDWDNTGASTSTRLPLETQKHARQKNTPM